MQQVPSCSLDQNHGLPGDTLPSVTIIQNCIKDTFCSSELPKNLSEIAQRALIKVNEQELEALKFVVAIRKVTIITGNPHGLKNKIFLEFSAGDTIFDIILKDEDKRSPDIRTLFFTRGIELFVEIKKIKSNEVKKIEESAEKFFQKAITHRLSVLSDNLRTFLNASFPQTQPSRTPSSMRATILSSSTSLTFPESGYIVDHKTMLLLFGVFLDKDKSFFTSTYCEFFLCAKAGGDGNVVNGNYQSIRIRKNNYPSIKIQDGYTLIDCIEKSLIEDKMEFSPKFYSNVTFFLDTVDSQLSTFPPIQFHLNAHRDKIANIRKIIANLFVGIDDLLAPSPRVLAQPGNSNNRSRIFDYDKLVGFTESIFLINFSVSQAICVEALMSRAIEDNKYSSKKLMLEISIQKGENLVECIERTLREGQVGQPLFQTFCVNIKKLLNEIEKYSSKDFFLQIYFNSNKEVLTKISEFLTNYWTEENRIFSEHCLQSEKPGCAGSSISRSNGEKASQIKSNGRTVVRRRKRKKSFKKSPNPQELKKVKREPNDTIVSFTTTSQQSFPLPSLVNRD